MIPIKDILLLIGKSFGLLFVVLCVIYFPKRLVNANVFLQC